MNRFEYDGPVHVRPVGRGIVLEDHRDGTTLDDAIERMLPVDNLDVITRGWEGRLRVVVEVVEARTT